MKKVVVGSAAISPPHLSESFATSVTMAMTSAETKIFVRKKTVADMAFPKTVS
jgi:hypothetical protein